MQIKSLTIAALRFAPLLATFALTPFTVLNTLFPVSEGDLEPTIDSMIDCDRPFGILVVSVLLVFAFLMIPLISYKIKAIQFHLKKFVLIVCAISLTASCWKLITCAAMCYAYLQAGNCFD